MKIGTIQLKHGLLLAPMAGITDRSFRRICRENGAEYTVTEMVSASAIHYRDKKTDELARLYDGEGPAAIQLFGRDPSIMAEAAVHLTETLHPDVIDLNMGCPVRKIVTNGEGSALMRCPELVSQIVEAVVRAVSVPVTVKIRSGWDDGSVNAVEIARRSEAAGAAMVAVHGRTRAQLYQPPVDLTIIRAVKEALTVPVVGNGGIGSPEDAVKMLRETGCDGVMIARGSCGNPWIFAQTAALLEGREPEVPDKETRLRTARFHLELLVADKGERVGICEARRFISWYMKGMEGAAALRNEINFAVTKAEVLRLIDNMG